MTSSQQEEVVKYVFAREEVFRHHFSNTFAARNTRRLKVRKTTIPPGVRWKQGQDTPIECYHSISVPELHRLPSQLKPDVLKSFLAAYPLGEAERNRRVTIPADDDSDSASSNTSNEQRTFLPKDKSLEEFAGETPTYKTTNFFAKDDAAFVIRDIDAAFAPSAGYPSYRKSSLFNPSGYTDDNDADLDPEGNESSLYRLDRQEIQENSVYPVYENEGVPSLLCLAKRSVRENIIKDRNRKERAFVKELRDTYKAAQESHEEVCKKKERELKQLSKGPEQKEIDRLHRLLQKAERKLKDREEEIESSAVEQIEFIQETYDQSRACAVAKFVENRDAYLNNGDVMHIGAAACRECSRIFLPHARDALPCYQRCSVAGCKATEEYCMDCSSFSCNRCCSPLCALHAVNHEVICQVEYKHHCGYNPSSSSMKPGIERSECCGRERQKGKYGFHFTICEQCGVYTCTDCNFKSSFDGSSADLCLGCLSRKNPNLSMGNSTRTKPSRWSSTECKEKRGDYDACSMRWIPCSRTGGPKLLSLPIDGTVAKMREVKRQREATKAHRDMQRKRKRHVQM